MFKAIAASGETIGHIWFGGSVEKNRSASIPRVLIGDRELRGAGHCQAVIKPALQKIFKDLKLHLVGFRGVFEEYCRNIVL